MSRKDNTNGRSGKLDDPDLFVNRELSWLEFNDRVLREGLDESLPLLERAKFLAIVSSNLDEFFMIRVAGLKQQHSAGVRKTDPSGMTPGDQIRAISERAHRMVSEQQQGVIEVLGKLAGHGLKLLAPESWTPQQRSFLQSHFDREILPVLTPLAIDDVDVPPLLPNLQMNVAALVSPPGQENMRIVGVPVPGQIPRMITIPAEEGIHLALLEDVIAANIGKLLPDCEIRSTAAFRITRDADVSIQDDEAGDLLEAVEKAVTQRRRRHAVRLTITAGAHERIRTCLIDWLDIDEQDVYDIEGMLDAASLMEIAGREGYENLKYGPWSPQSPRDLMGSEDLFETLQERDVMLCHPYESFDPVVELVRKAADDPDVLAIKQTLYRTSGDSPIVKALRDAAENGKQVTVLVELKARFDEARNVIWARQLEDAGCHVIYGVAGLKTHAKILLIVRRESGRIRRYVHLSTGNYNDKTARLYSDIGLMTCDTDLALDAASFFNLLTGYSEVVGWSKLSIAPTGLRRRIRELIEREARASTPDRPGLIMAKINSLQDKEVCQELYRASQAGVKILLNVRGICCLRPGIEGISESIKVRAIIDRYLEHARIFYFRNGGHEEVYLSSADWMTRNLDKRLETLFPIVDPSLRRRLVGWLELYMSDNVKGWQLKPDGTYERVRESGPRIRAQEALQTEAEEIARSAERTQVRFRPLTRPEG